MVKGQSPREKWKGEDFGVSFLARDGELLFADYEMTCTSRSCYVDPWRNVRNLINCPI